MKDKRKAGIRLTGMLAVVGVLLFAGCATTTGGSSKALGWKQADPSVFGSRQFNAISLKTFGPYSRQLYGYVLYGDGVGVSVSGQITGSPMGKVTLADVQQDYQRILRENMITSGGNLILREVLRNGAVVAYTATQPFLDVTVWDTAPDNPVSNTVLQVAFP